MSFLKFFFDREFNWKTIPEALAKCLLCVNSVESILAKQDTYEVTKEFTLGKTLTNVNSVANVLVAQDIWKNMNESTLGRSLMNVDSAISVFIKQETLGDI